MFLYPFYACIYTTLLLFYIETRIQVLVIISCYIAAITVSILFKKYRRLSLKLTRSLRKEKRSLKTWLKYAFLWGTVYIGVGAGTFCFFVFNYGMSFILTFHIPDRDLISMLVLINYPAWITGGFFAGNMLYYVTHCRKPAAQCRKPAPKFDAAGIKCMAWYFRIAPKTRKILKTSFYLFVCIAAACMVFFNVNKILVVISSWTIAIILSPLFQKYPRLILKTFISLRKEQCSLKTWLKYTFLWGTAYIGFGHGCGLAAIFVFCPFMIIYILPLPFPPRELISLSQCAHIYLVCITGGFLLGNALYAKHCVKLTRTQKK
jgi:hypothetical protein